MHRGTDTCSGDWETPLTEAANPCGVHDSETLGS